MLRPKLNRIWASTNSVTRRDPGDAKYIQGWISEIPTYQVLNYLQYKIDTTLLALAERGIFEWGNDVQYGLNSLVWDETNKTIYISTVGSPDKTKAPSANPTQWVASSIQVSRASYDSVVANINAHIADITGNPHKLTAGRLNAYNKSEIDNIVAQYRALVKIHVDDKNNPHGVTASQAGAVPATGGTYSGDVIFNAGVWFDSGKVNGLVKTGGIYLKNGNGQIGVSDSGVAQVGKIGALSPIVSESTFPALKAAREPEYATPLPNYASAFIGDINIQVGMGSQEASFDPLYSVVTGALGLGTSTGQTNRMNSSDSIGGSTESTIAVDFLETNARVSADGSKVLQFSSAPNENGTEGVYLFIGGNSRLVAERMYNPVGGSATYEYTQFQLTGDIQTWRRLAATFSGTTIKLYLDGVMVAQNRTATVTAGVKTNKVNIFIAQRDAAGARGFQVRNLRVWTQALTDKQISTL